MKFVNVIFKSKKFLTLLIALWITNEACFEQQTTSIDFETEVAFILLGYEYNCSLPNAIDIGAGNKPPSRNCISEKSSNGLIYNNTSGLAITTSSVTNGAQLECRDLGGTLNEYNSWYKSNVVPIPSGYPIIAIELQKVNKDGSGNVISYQPFSNYLAGDTLICLPNNRKNYQTLRIL